MKTEGLFFRRFDLHIHTPASKCFSDKNVTPEQIVHNCIQMGLSAIAITDHNTGEWVDKVKDAAKYTNLIVFPGVEMTVGDAHVHVIAILDVDKTTRDIQDLLSAAEIYHDKFGKEDAFSPKSVIDIIDIITGYPFNGQAILSHIDSTSGVFNQMQGEPRKKVIQHDRLLAVEAINYEKVSGLLNGKDKIYETKLAVYQSSDNPYIDENGKPLVTGTHSGKHSIDGIGFRFSYFKVDKHITLESLRQCFIDPDVRIRQVSEYREVTCPYIKSVKVKGGFLSDEELVLHYGLNSILGGKGVGKSLIVEFMRFALDQESHDPKITEDHEGKLGEQLGQYGQIEIIVSDEAGREFQIIRKYDPHQGNPIECRYLSNGGSIDISIPQIFPVLFLSQTEIIRMAEDPDAQMHFIDQFFDFQRFLNQLKDIEIRLGELDRVIAESIEAYKERKQLNERLQTMQVESERLLEQLQNPIFDEYSELENKDKAFRTHNGFLETLREHINAFKGIIEHEEIPEFPMELSSESALGRTEECLRDAKSFLIDNFAAQQEKLSEMFDKIQKEYITWKALFDKKREEYQEEVLKLGGDAQKLEEKRRSKVEEIENIESRLSVINSKARRLEEITNARDEKLSELRKIYNTYFQTRKEKCEYFEKSSNGRLQVSIIESTSRDEFMECLLSLKTGSYIREQDIEQLCGNIGPGEFVYNLILYDIAHFNETEDPTKYIKSIAQKTNLSEDKIRNLADHLLNTKNYEEILPLQYKAHPQDRPDIKYNVGDNDKPVFKPLKDLSTGQKCTAMVILALSEGAMPIVIDQPEDSLDIRTIWDDLCCKLRSGKETRQFIFTTHNSSVAVASDTDKFTIMTASAEKGKIMFSGAIDSEHVKREVITYLEGGEPTYELKYSKYNILK